MIIKNFNNNISKNDLKIKASQTEETYIESLINHEIQNGILADLDTYLKIEKR